MGADQVAPCRHAGVAPEDVIRRSIDAIQNLGAASEYLAAQGLSVAEYAAALPVAIQRMRGSAAASTSIKRQYLKNIFKEMLDRGLISSVQQPKYGEDTVYRLSVADFGDIAIIQKGCPDGHHSSSAWEVPGWAKETYLWWLCPSLRYAPGVHINKGINRMSPRFFSDANLSEKLLDGVIFNNEICGSPRRPCPKMNLGISIADSMVMPPCIYVLPERHLPESPRNVVFPGILLSLFGVNFVAAPDYVGQVSFYNKGSKISKKISLRFGAGKSTIYRG